MKQLKLNELEAMKLSERQLSKVTGGSERLNCSCGCNGPSSTKDNKTANIEGGLQSPGVDVCDSIFSSITVTW